MKEILKLIKDYQNAVKASVEEMQQQFNTSYVFQARRKKIIPTEGVLNSGMEYEFHGGGCAMTRNNITVDFDFGPDDRCDGFDVWRLSCFVDENPELYKEYFEKIELLKEDFRELLDKKIIVEPKWHPGETLCYFSDVIK